MLFQSTLPRGERLIAEEKKDEEVIISIHAPARGATVCSFSGFPHTFRISIHAPARGATRANGLSLNTLIHFNPRSREGSDSRVRHRPMLLPYFNPRSREGSDALRRYRHGLHNPISIHAPARGATHKTACNQNRFYHFNPRSREGSDCIY